MPVLRERMRELDAHAMDRGHAEHDAGQVDDADAGRAGRAERDALDGLPACVG